MKIKSNAAARKKAALAEIMLWVLPAVWCFLISQFSLQSAVESSAVSSGIAKKVAEVVVKTTESIPGMQGKLSFSLVHHLVRKAAHFFIFSVLGFLLLMRGETLFGNKTRQIAAAVLIVGFLSAVTDECTQYFVPGRSAQPGDVMIDFSGVLTGCVFFRILLGLFAKRR